MNDIFNIKGNTNYHLRHTSQFCVDPISTVFNGSKSVFYLEPKFGNKYLPKLKILILMMVTKNKLENGNL